MDPLSDVIALLRPNSVISKPITGRGTWGVRYAAHDAPGFTIVLKGECWIAFEGQPAFRMGQGDFLLLPSTPAFTLSSGPGMAGEAREPTDIPVRHGEQEGEADFESLGGAFGIERVNASLLLALLPRMIHIRLGGADRPPGGRDRADHGRVRTRRARQGHDPAADAGGPAGRGPALAGRGPR